MHLPFDFGKLLPTKRWQRRLLEGGLILAIILGAQYFQTRGLPEGVAPPLVGLLADGGAVKLSTGGTATLVAFWATWCPVCSAEEGNIVSVALDHRVVSVAMQSGDAAAVTKHLKERGIVLPVLVDDDGRHAQNWRVRGVPTHFVVDGAGNIRFRSNMPRPRCDLRWAETFPA